MIYQSLILFLKSVFFTVSFIAILIFSFSLVEFIFFIRPFKHRSERGPAQLGMEYERVSFKSAGNVTLKGWWIPNRKARSTVIVGHGYLFDKGAYSLDVSIPLHDRYNVFLFDHRYFGESGGMITTIGNKETEDVKAAVRYVRRKKGRNHPIAIYSYSMGASATLMARQDVRAVVVDSPYANLERAVRQTMDSFGLAQPYFISMMNLLAKIFLKMELRKVSPADAVKDYHVPVFLIHGTKDSTINVKNAYILKRVNPGIKLWIVEGAEHVHARDMKKEEYDRKVRAFLKKHLP